MSDSEIITATEASRAFSDVLHRVSYKGESFLIKKGNRLMARIVPVEAGEEAETPRKTKIEKSAPAKPAPRIVAEHPAEKSPPPKQKTAAPKPAPVSAKDMSVPESFTQDDVDFYQNLIANMGGKN